MSRRALAVLVLLSSPFAAGCPTCGLVPGPITDGGERDGGTPGDDAGTIEEACDPRTFLVEGEPARLRLAVLVDVSGSHQFTDGMGYRVAGLTALMEELTATGGTEVRTFAFGAVPYADPAGWVPGAAWTVPSFVETHFDILADLQGGLAAVGAALRADVASWSEEERARTVLGLFILADGSPSPICCNAAEEREGALGDVDPSCPDDVRPAAEPERVYCDGFAEEPLCDRADFLANFRSLSAVDAGYALDDPVAGLEIEGDYNRRDTLAAMAGELRADLLALGLLDMRVHSGHLQNRDVDPVVNELYRLEHCTLKALLVRLANAGHGAYANFDTSAPVDFFPLVTSCADP